MKFYMERLQTLKALLRGAGQDGLDILIERDSTPYSSSFEYNVVLMENGRVRVTDNSVEGDGTTKWYTLPVFLEYAKMGRKIKKGLVSVLVDTTRWYGDDKDSFKGMLVVPGVTHARHLLKAKHGQSMLWVTTVGDILPGEQNYGRVYPKKHALVNASGDFASKHASGDSRPKHAFYQETFRFCKDCASKVIVKQNCNALILTNENDEDLYGKICDCCHAPMGDWLQCKFCDQVFWNDQGHTCDAFEDLSDEEIEEDFLVKSWQQSPVA